MAQVAQRMGVTHHYVQKLSAQARAIMGAATTVQAVAVAIELGLLSVDHGQGARLRRVREHAAAIAELLA